MTAEARSVSQEDVFGRVNKILSTTKVCQLALDNFSVSPDRVRMWSVVRKFCGSRQVFI